MESQSSFQAESQANKFSIESPASLGVLVVDVVPQPPPVCVVVPAVLASRRIRGRPDSVLQSDVPVACRQS